jgi:hypothetical protein
MDFLVAFSRFLRWDGNGAKFHVCGYIMELTLRSRLYHEFSAIGLAGASIVLTNFALKEDELWPDNLAQVSTLSLTELAPCAVKLSNYIEQERAAVSRHSLSNMTHFRYAKDGRKGASQMAMPHISSERVLLNYGTKKRKR